MTERCPLCGLPAIFGSLQGCLCTSTAFRAKIAELEGALAESLKTNALLSISRSRKSYVAMKACYETAEKRVADWMEYWAENAPEAPYYAELKVHIAELEAELSRKRIESENHARFHLEAHSRAEKAESERNDALHKLDAMIAEELKQGNLRLEADQMLDISNRILNDYKDKWQRALKEIDQLRYKKEFAEDEANRLTDIAQKKEIEIRRLNVQYAEVKEVLGLWEDHGSLSNEDCEGCRRAEHYRVTGILLPRKDG